MEKKANSFVVVARAGDIAEGKARSFDVDGHHILVALVGGKYYAAENACPHMGEANLSEGTLEGTVVTCPKHASKFDLADGRVVRWTDWTGVKAPMSRLFAAPKPPVVYQAKQEGTDILVSLDS